MSGSRNSPAPGLPARILIEDVGDETIIRITRGSTMTKMDLDASIESALALRSKDEPLKMAPYKPFRESVLDALDVIYLRAAIALYGSDVPAIAAATGIDKSNVYRLMRRHNL